MSLPKWLAITTRHRRTTILLALLTTFAGVALLIDRPKGTVLEWFAVPILVSGGSLFAWAVWPRGALGPTSGRSTANRLLARLTWNGRLVPLFPVLGVAIVIADFGYNLTLSATPAFQTEDTIVLFGAATLLSYNFVPTRFARERDFVLLFFLWLNAILVVPLLIARLYYADFEHSVDVYSWVALAPQTSAVLSFLGVANSVHSVAGSTAPGLTFMPQHIPAQVTVVITTACSGIYSFGIFASAFVAFVLTEHERMSSKVWLLLVLGFLAAYVANVLRMVVIVLIGYFTDTAQTDLQNMLLAHSYAGWIIFLGWIAMFWTFIVKFLPIEGGDKNQRASTMERAEGTCALCAGSLTPTIPATRCLCGTVMHKACWMTSPLCPRCGRIFRNATSLVSRGTQTQAK